MPTHKVTITVEVETENPEVTKQVIQEELEDLLQWPNAVVEIEEGEVGEKSWVITNAMRLRLIHAISYALGTLKHGLEPGESVERMFDTMQTLLDDMEQGGMEPKVAAPGPAEAQFQAALRRLAAQRHDELEAIKGRRAAETLGYGTMRDQIEKAFDTIIELLWQGEFSEEDAGHQKAGLIIGLQRAAHLMETELFYGPVAVCFEPEASKDKE